MRARAAGTWMMSWALLVALGACRPGDRPHASGPQAASASTGGFVQATERRFVRAQWERIWIHGGHAGDTTLLIPFAITASAGRVYVADRAEQRVLALAADDGALAWMAGRRGGGPEEFRRVDAIAAAPDGGVVVADGGNGRIAFLDSAGRTHRHVRPEGLPIYVTLCPLSDGSVVVGTGGPVSPVVHVGRDGGIRSRPALPWPDLNELYPAVPRQGIFAPEPGGAGCAYALALGRGFTRFAAGRFQPPRPYVESFPLPRSVLTPSIPGQPPNEQLEPGWTEAVRGLAVAGDALVLAFWGKTADRGRLLDVYDRASGRYRHSIRVPEPVERVAYADGIFFFLTTRGGYPAVVAMRLRAMADAPA